MSEPKDFTAEGAENAEKRNHNFLLRELCEHGTVWPPKAAGSTYKTSRFSAKRNTPRTVTKNKVWSNDRKLHYL